MGQVRGGLWVVWELGLFEESSGRVGGNSRHKEPKQKSSGLSELGMYLQCMDMFLVCCGPTERVCNKGVQKSGIKATLQPEFSIS